VESGQVPPDAAHEATVPADGAMRVLVRRARRAPSCVVTGPSMAKML
jgi:hypothetical protein